MISHIDKIILLARKHYVALIISSLIGLVVVGPQILFIYNLGGDYRGIYITTADAELHYLSRMREAVEGGGFGNPFIYEYKDNVPSTTYTISELILAFPAKVFGFSVPSLSLFYKFLLPMIIALLVYGLTYRLIGNRLWSWFSMVMIVLGSALINLPDLIHFLQWEKIYTQFTLYSRPVNPEFSSILFFTYLHVLLTALRKKTWHWFISLGILFGFSFYVYFYSYTFLLALNVVIFCIQIIKKENEIAFKIFSVGVVGLTIGLFSIINSIELYTHPFFKEMAGLSEIVSSNKPIISIAGVITLVVFIFFAFKNKDDQGLTFLGGLLVTSFVVVNQQVITGMLMQEGHYHWYFNTPIFILVLIVAGYYFIGQKYKNVGIALVIFISFIAIADAVLIQTSSYEHGVDKALSNQKYMTVLSWLNDQTPKGSVVLANQAISAFIPVYTSNNVVWEDHASFYLLPKSRRNFNQEIIMSSSNLQDALLLYRVDYLVWDIKNEPTWQLNNYPFLKQVYSNDEFKIYEK